MAATRGDPLRRVTPGQPIIKTAARENMVSDSVRDYVARRGSGGAGYRGRRGLPPVFAQNNSGNVKRLFHVAGIGNPIFTAGTQQFKSEIIVSAVLPTTEHYGRFLVFQDTVDEGRIGRVVIDGPTFVKVEVTNASYQYAEIEPSTTTKLISGPSGSARIVWKEGGTGGRLWALVVLGTDPERPVLFPVKVWKDGGADGSQTTKCTATYTVRTIEATAVDTGGIPLGTTLTPERERPAYGKQSVASASGSGTIGTGYFSAATFHLYDANEIYNVTLCPT